MSDGFLSRWARRKEAVKAAEQAPPAQVSPVSQVPQVSAEPTEPLQARVPSPQGEEARAPDTLAFDDRTAASQAPADTEQHLLELPSLDALTPETDLTPFLRTGVPSALRNAALRRMWSLDPSIRDFVSEAREYAYDWNTPGGVPGLGPLLPSDDVKAMLGRLFRDPAEATKPASEPSAEEPDEVPADSPEATVAQAGDAAPAIEASPAPVSVAPAEPDPPKVAQTSRPEPRLRRHGGAMPG